MEQNFVLNGNKLIAEFMGWHIKTRFHYIRMIEVKEWTLPTDSYPFYIDYNDGYLEVNGELFHESWDWLMPVVEKIESLGYFVKISTKVVAISRDNKGNQDSDLVQAIFGDETKLQKTYKCVLSAIRYINYLKNKK